MDCWKFSWSKSVVSPTVLSLLILAQFGHQDPLAIKAGSFAACPSNSNRFIFEVLPGSGWDSLRNLEMSRVLALNYSLCLTTEDGKYIVPNDFTLVPLKATEMDLSAETFYHYKDYSPLTSESITSEARAQYSACGSYSKEYDEVKKALLQTSANKEAKSKKDKVISRVVMDHKIYSVIVQRGQSLLLSAEFNDRLKELGDELMAAPTKTPSYADYLAESIIQQFGTHYIYSLDAGASLAKIDNLSRQSDEMKACATRSFTEYLKMNVHLSSTCSSESVNVYQASTSFSRVTSAGGPPFSPGMELASWRSNMENNLVAIDRKGDFLDTLIKKSIFTEYPEPIVREMQRRVRKAIKRYFEMNSVRGCMDLTSTFLDLNANVDDPSMCMSPKLSFYLAGVYQTCEEDSSFSLDKDGGKSKSVYPGITDPCLDIRAKNPITNDDTCPSNSATNQLLDAKVKICHPNCQSSDLTSCQQICKILHLRTFWCSAENQATPHLSFGGIHSEDPQVVNPLTHGYTCPVGYISHRFTSKSAIICVGLHDHGDSGFPSALTFGGFYSCFSGNVYAKGERSCPSGFSKHLAFVQHSCQVYYCVASTEISKLEITRLQLPPYTDVTLPSRNKLDGNDYSMKEVDLGGVGQHWIVVNGQWKLSSDVTMKDLVQDTDKMLIKRFFTES